MTLALWMIAATTLAQPAEVPPPPPEAPPPLAEDFVTPVPDDQVPFEDQAPPEYPRVIRRGDQICQQSLKEDGSIGTICRPGRFTAARDEAFPRFAAAGGVLGGGSLFAGNGIAPGGGFSVLGEFGARFSRWAGAVLVLGYSMFFYGGANLMGFSFAPGFRLGGKMHFTLSVGPTIVIVNAQGGSGVGIAGTVQGTGVFPVAGPFSLLAQFGVTFDASAVSLGLAGGVGFSI
ncbi:MAG: hypothetical protein AB1938_31325 [Myxococcota bacterium]